MLKALQYKVTFPSTGRTLQFSRSFDQGLTAITGPNEAGKSFVIEMIRFALFGTAALRGKSDDYADLTCRMEFKDYAVWRTIDKAKLWCGDDLLATGVRAVNAKIVSILGFDLTVFDVVGVTNQGDVERLGNMKPAERKRMVDQTIGVDRLDELTKWCAEQGSLLSREIEVLSRTMGEEPVAPERPEGYHCSSSLRVQVDHRRGMKQEFDTLTGWLSVTKPEPVRPAKPELPVGDRDAELALIDENAAKRKHLRSLPIIDFDPAEVRKAWDAYDKWDIYDVWKGHNPRPVLSREVVEEYVEVEARRVRHAELSAQFERYAKLPLMQCPHCSTKFCLEHEALKQVQDQLTAFGEIPPQVFKVSALQEQLRLLDNWDRPEVQEMARVLSYGGPQPPKPAVTREQLAEAPLGITRAALAEQLAVLPFTRERATVVQEIEAQRLYQLHLQSWEIMCDGYVTWLTERQEKQARADELAPSVAELPTLEDALQRSIAYENLQGQFEAAYARYLGLKEELDEKTKEHDGWKLARTFIAEVRTRIKTHLVPSLSAVASHLLAQMTGGARTSIYIDEEFEITVDGQPLGTLSGSGKACANLALRIGLGQVLTHGILSLFIGDEIDASMDDERAEDTHNSLQGLTNRISQILLISHKSPEADFTIQLGENAGDRQ